MAVHRDRAVRARAGFVLASTFFRLGMSSEAQDAVHDGVRLLDRTCPPHWGAEHHMALALYTSYGRAGPADWELFEEAVRRARMLDEPILLLAVLNKYAWASQHDPAMRDRAVELIDEMETLLEDGRIIPPAAMLDTIAWIRLSQGRVDDADRLLGRALTARRTEPNDDAALLAHLATVRHRQGRLDEATRLLETARVVALRARTPALAVEALRHLAAVDADRGDFRRAYRRLSRFVAEQSATERAEAERQATILQSVYGTQAERDQRLYYQELAMRDPLTRLYNRRHVERELPLLLRDSGVAVAMIDVDHFKEINDNHSHEVGDEVLAQLAALLHEHAVSMAPAGFCARLGGEEFLLVAPAVAPTTAVASLQQLQHTRRDPPVGAGPSSNAPDDQHRARDHRRRRTFNPRPCSLTPTRRCTWPSETAATESRRSSSAMGVNRPQAAETISARLAVLSVGPVGRLGGPGIGIDAAIASGNAAGACCGAYRRRPMAKSGRSRVRNGPPHAGQASSSAVAAGVKRSRQSGQDARVTTDPQSSHRRCTSAGEASGRVASGQPTPAARTGLRDHRILQLGAAGLEVHLVTTEAEDVQTLPARTAILAAAAVIVRDEKHERGCARDGISPLRVRPAARSFGVAVAMADRLSGPSGYRVARKARKTGCLNALTSATRLRPINSELPGRVVRWS